MNLSKAQVINLILGFFFTPMGFWVDVKYDDMPELNLFIEAGFTCIDEEDERKIVCNEQGKEFLFLHFKEISNDFILFMRKQGMECVASDVEKWFVEKYDLDDIETGADIAFLIANKLSRFGYECVVPIPERKDYKYIMRKIL